MMRAEARVDLLAITKNVEKLKKQSGVELLAVVKADAYGHGLTDVARAAINGGASWLGVALPEEALALRAAGITHPILSWLVSPGADYKALIENDIDIAVASILSLHEITSVQSSRRARIHLEVDTGMTRGGFLGEWSQLLKEDLSKVDVVGIFSHFARADEPNEKQNIAQLESFKKYIADLDQIGIDPPIKHLSNSAATLLDSKSTFSMVRTGIAMYGLTPDISLGDSKRFGLLPAMQLRAELHLVKEVPAGSPVGYGASAITKCVTKLGIVAMGYADGIPRIAQGAGVYFKGSRAPIIGRISMDQFVVDLGPTSSAKSGDWVVIFGDGSQGEYTADDWGAASQSINYEITTRIGPRVPRIYGAHVY